MVLKFVGHDISYGRGGLVLAERFIEFSRDVTAAMLVSPSNRPGNGLFLCQRLLHWLKNMFIDHLKTLYSVLLQHQFSMLTFFTALLSSFSFCKFYNYFLRENAQRRIKKNQSYPMKTAKRICDLKEALV